MTDLSSHTVYIAIGSNIGERLDNCRAAIQHIESLPSTTTIKESKWINNPALSPNNEDPDFINGVIQIITALVPEKLLENLQNIEERMGRPKDRPRWSPRIIDLDIILYDDIVLDAPTLKIPHPEMNKRIFVLKPLCDIDPDIVHPVLGQTAQELLNSLG